MAKAINLGLFCPAGCSGSILFSSEEYLMAETDIQAATKSRIDSLSNSNCLFFDY